MSVSAVHRSEERPGSENRRTFRKDDARRRCLPQNCLGMPLAPRRLRSQRRGGEDGIDWPFALELAGIEDGLRDRRPAGIEIVAAFQEGGDVFRLAATDAAERQVRVELAALGAEAEL